MSHATKHTLSGSVTKVKLGDEGPLDFTVEDWWDRLMGVSWRDSNGNPAALNYAIRNGFHGLPLDDEVVYGKIDGMGHLVHESEFVK